MELSFLQANISNPAVLLPEIRKAKQRYYEALAAYEYDPLNKQRNVNKRQDEYRQVATGVVGADGQPLTTSKLITTNRIAIPLQRLIVSRLTAFITGGGVSLSAAPTDAQKPVFDAVKTTWSRNKLDFKNGSILSTMLSECEVAEVWYSTPVVNGKTELKCKIYKPSDGFSFMPVFDRSDDLVAFGVEYERNDAEGKKVTYHDLYTADTLVKHEKRDGEDKIVATITLPYGKMPVVYYQQDRSVWQNVQSLIDRLETVVSNFCDTNDYFAAPILSIMGEIMGAAEKGKAGQAIQLDNGAKAEYLTWNQMPEAIKLEMEMLIDQIYACVQCPRTSFSDMKGLANVPSGAAFDRVMIDAHLKAKEYQQGTYGLNIQRRINFLASACSSVLRVEADLDITPVFTEFRVNDLRERVEVLLLANGNKPIIDVLTATELSGLTTDPQGAVNAMEADAQKAAELAIMVAGHGQDTSQAGIDGSKTKIDNGVTKVITRNTTTNAQNANAA